jgi:excisionase family DNA binding protein
MSAPARIVYTPEQAAEALGVSSRQIGRWMAAWRTTRGRAGLRHARLGPRCVRIRAEDLAALLEGASRAV